MIWALEHALITWLECGCDKDLFHKWYLALGRFYGDLDDLQQTCGLVALVNKLHLLPENFPNELLKLAKATYDVKERCDDYDESIYKEVKEGQYGKFDGSTMYETFLRWLFAFKFPGKDIYDAVEMYLHHQNEVCKKNLEEMVRKTENCRSALAASEQALETLQTSRGTAAKRNAVDGDGDGDGSRKKTKVM